MAQNVQIILTCDIDDSEDEVSTVSFAYNGDAYSLELCATDKAELESFLEPYVTAARHESPKPRRSRSTSASSKPASPSNPSEIRGWAQSNGYTVSARGRIPAEVREAYEAASA